MTCLLDYVRKNSVLVKELKLLIYHHCVSKPAQMTVNGQDCTFLARSQCYTLDTATGNLYCGIQSQANILVHNFAAFELQNRTAIKKIYKLVDSMKLT